MYYVILIFGSWNFICGAECKVAKTKLDEIFIKKFNIRVFFQTYKTYAAAARKWAEVREDFRTCCDSCLHIVCSNKKSFTVRARCLHSLCRIDVSAMSHRPRRRKPLYAFSSSLVIALQGSSGAVTLTRSIAPSESRRSRRGLELFVVYVESGARAKSRIVRKNENKLPGWVGSK